MFTYFEEQKRRIAGCLREHGGGGKGYAGEALTRLVSYACRGKMIRGGLAVLGYELAGGAPADAVVPLAAALELLQSALLIHDDVMDRDVLRRGEPTLHREYAREASAGSLRDPDHVGIAHAVCAGDIAIFAAFRLIALTAMPDDRLRRIVALVSREMESVGAAQMKDVSWGAAPTGSGPGSEEEVLDLYRYKTARYSFSLPLLAGAAAAGRPAGNAEALDRFGERLGLIFQIRDDELGLFGDEAAVGKPVGSDIREGKKTLMSVRLRSRLVGVERERFEYIFGRADIGPEEIGFVRRLMEAHGVRAEMNGMIDRYAGRCRAEFASLAATRPDMAGLLASLVDYSVRRKW